MTINKTNAGVFWVTGISGSGKSTFSYYLKNELEKNCHSTVILDGDNIRQILSEEQKYTKKERLSLAYKYANLAKIINRYNINVIVSTISLFHEIHEFNRTNFNKYIEIFLDRDIKEIKKEDIKSIYKKRKNIVGLDIDAEYPKNPDYIFKNVKENDYPRLSESIISKFQGR